MKKTQHLSSLILATLTLAANVPAQVGQTIDDLPARTTTTWVADIAAGSNSIFTVGHDDLGDGTYLNFLRYSVDGGATWASSPDTLQTGRFTDVVVGPDGHVYVGATLRDPGSGLNLATVLRSTDLGATWQILDAWSSAPGSAGINDLCFDRQGNLYAACFAGSGSWKLGSRWVIRKGTLSGAGFTWSTVDNHTLNKAYDQEASAVVTRSVAVGQDEVFVGGMTKDRSGLHWTLRRSRDGGLTWTTVDSYQHVLKSGWNWAHSVTVGPDGSVYAGGTMTYDKGTSAYGGWVRVSRDGGQTWQNGSFPVSRIAGGLAADNAGNAFALGYWGDARETYVSNDGGLTWQIADIPGGSPATDASGRVFTQCHALDAGGSAHFLIRELDAP